MLERLADLLRAQDSRGGFEANPDMLSITGMTLEQFANLMEGLGYKAERGEREKPQRAPETPSEDAASERRSGRRNTAQDDTAAASTDEPKADEAKPEAAAMDGPTEEALRMPKTPKRCSTPSLGVATSAVSEPATRQAPRQT